MNNIQQFDRCVTRIFARLYEAFPLPIDLEYHEVLDEPALEVAEDGLAFVEATLRWLADSEYVRVRDFDNFTAIKVVLSPKALEVLKAVPEALETQGTIGESFVAFAKEKSSSAASALVSLAITEAWRRFGMGGP